MREKERESVRDSHTINTTFTQHAPDELCGDGQLEWPPASPPPSRAATSSPAGHSFFRPLLSAFRPPPLPHSRFLGSVVFMRVLLASWAGVQGRKWKRRRQQCARCKQWWADHPPCRPTARHAHTHTHAHAQVHAQTHERTSTDATPASFTSTHAQKVAVPLVWLPNQDRFSPAKKLVTSPPRHPPTHTSRRTPQDAHATRQRAHGEQISPTGVLTMAPGGRGGDRHHSGQQPKPHPLPPCCRICC